MKKQLNSLLTQSNSHQKEILINEVNENLAPGFYNSNGKIFTTTDLWNIQRQAKNRIQRRFSY